jgi:hypothetical protein
VVGRQDIDPFAKAQQGRFQAVRASSADAASVVTMEKLMMTMPPCRVVELRASPDLARRVSKHRFKCIPADVGTADHDHGTACRPRLLGLHSAGDGDTGCPFEQHMMGVDEKTHGRGDLRF